jgi:hypothetical protein
VGVTMMEMGLGMEMGWWERWWRDRRGVGVMAFVLRLFGQNSFRRVMLFILCGFFRGVRCMVSRVEILIVVVTVMVIVIVIVILIIAMPMTMTMILWKWRWGQTGN